MVNTGKASLACAICKKRRVKCDLKKPACSQCIKSGWTCPGPRNETEIVFKDQTEIVMRNSSGSRQTSKCVYSASRSHTPPYSLTRTVPPSTPDRGTAFFMHQYMFPREGGSSLSIYQGHYEYIPELLCKEGPTGPLRTIIAAAGLAALSNAGNVTAWAVESYKLYNEAIRQLQSTLSNPVTAFMDPSIAAIMLMGTFETIASGDVSSMKFYGDHTMAAARCLDLCTPTQLRGNPPLKMFLELRRIIFMTCHQLQMDIPSAVGRWSKWAEQLQQPEHLYSNRFAEINAHVAAIRANMKLRGVTSPALVAAELLSVDEQLIRWKQNLPQPWSYMVGEVPVWRENFLFIWRSRYDMYTDLWVAAVWNSYRCVRLIIHEAIIKAVIAHGSDDHQSLLQASANTLKQIVDDVCSSVPYLLGHCLQDGQITQTDRQTQSRSLPIPGGYVLIWPLFLSAMLRTTSRAQREWMAGILRHIGVTMGLKLAMSMETTLTRHNRTFCDGDSWLNGDFCS